jgi:hypothetical protein
LAAGLFVISVALLFGGLGEPVATADTETDGTVSQTQGLGDQGEHADTTESEPTESTPATGVVDTIPELIAALDTEPNSTSDYGVTHQEPGGLTGPMAIGVSTDDGVSAAQATDEDNKGSDSVAAAAAEEVNEPEVVVSHSPVTEPSPEPEAPNTDVTAPANDPPAQDPTVVQPVANEVASVDDSGASAQAEAAPLVGGAAPATDVITALTNFFIALTNGSALLVNIPGDLLSMLGFPPVSGGVTASSLPAGGIGGSLMAGALHTAASSQLASSLAVQAGWPGLFISPGDLSALSSAGVVVHPTPAGLGATGMAEQHSVGLKAVLADGIVPDKVRAFIQHTVDAVLAPLSLLALAALASPGVTGLVLLGAAGMFVGYRQAKAASMLRAVGIARFVKAGPLGVVRSGGLVALHSRPSSARRRQSGRTLELLEPVA